MTSSRILAQVGLAAYYQWRTHLLHWTQRHSVPGGRRSMRTHMLQCECRWRRVRQLHQAMNHTLGTDDLGDEMRLWTRNSIGYKVCEYSLRLYHCSPCYDIDDWTVLYNPSALLLCDCFPIITPTLCGHCSPCYYINDRTVLSICVASLQLLPYHHSAASAPNSTFFEIITFFCCHHISQFPYVNDVMRGCHANLQNS
jgi:hypothetical protein